ALPLRLSELAILATARAWTQPVEWAIHAPIALREGIARHVIDALIEDRQPTFELDDEAIVFAFCDELHRTQQVSDATWFRAITAFGEHGTMDLVGLCGYYALLSMVMNAARTPVPTDPNTSIPALRPRSGSA
ncbi:MAG: carboxymuconolactone decarboxylase family protein, partial [Casimicrobium sp.]